MEKGERRGGRGRKAVLWEDEMWGEQEPLGTLPWGAEEGLATGAAAAFSIWQRTLDLVLHVNPVASARLHCPD